MKLGMISLGCAKNRIDTELFLGVANKYHIEITNQLKEADILVVNTCGFIESAKKEAIDTILELLDYQPFGKVIIAMGCLVERYLEDLKKSIPEVDFYVPIRDYNQIDQLFQTILNTKKSIKMDYLSRTITTKPHTAYLRIAEGCNNRCTYCAIPLIRGQFVSRDFASLLAEANSLANQGVKEITLIAQDTSRYGTDIENSPYRLEHLLHEMSTIKEIEKLRVLYLYPDEITDSFIEEMQHNHKIAPYFDIPIQHASDHMLAAMNRRGNQALLTHLIRKIRTMIPNAVIRTTLIVGFPGETASDFNELKDFVKEMKFERLGVFPYSDEEDTKAYAMKPKVPQKIAAARYHEIMQIQQDIVKQYNQSCIGHIYSCIIDQYNQPKNCYIARSDAYAPDDVDGVIYVKSDETLMIGHIYSVKITAFQTYDLIGERVKGA